MTFGNKFRVPEASAFERYYDEFLQNSLGGQRYKITLVDDQSAIGVPRAGSMADPRGNPKFAFIDGDGHVHHIPFSELKSAVRV